MISVTPCENTALLRGRPALVPTGPRFLSSFSLAAGRSPANANAFKMILLHKDSAKLPGMILLHKITTERGALFALRTPSRRNPFRICTLDENRCRQGRAGKSCKMISLYDSKNNLPGMILLRKKVGVPPVGALSMPNRRHPDGACHRERTLAR
jgi:hypothetical protein